MARVTTATPFIHAPIEIPGQQVKGDLSVYERDSPAVQDHRALVRKFISTSRMRWQTANAASASFRGKMRIDQKFAAGGGAQWDPVDRQQRADEGRPCLEINRIPQFIRQVSNQNRMNRSQIQVNPRGGGAVQATAWALQGVVRAIEVESDADVAYDTATDHQLRSGMGFVRLKVAWANQLKGMQRVCRLSRITNPLSVYWDPSVQEADFSDARYMHVIGVIGKDEYTARWGHLSSYQSLTEFMRTDASTDDWAPEGKVVLAEYFYIDVEARELLLMEDGAEIWQDELQDYHQAFVEGQPGVPVPGVQMQRTVQAPRVKWALHNGMDILEGNADRTAGRDVPGTRIPLFPVVGDEINIDGTVDYRGMVRDAIDPARMYNFWTSSIAEAVALAPKAPWIAASGQINEYLDDWKQANRVPYSVLQYDPKSVDGTLVPPPQRNVAEPAIQAMVMGLREADSDLKAVMGLFEPSLGEKGPQQSGKAITAMQQQGQVANSNFLDNLQRTKRSIGRALIAWIPAVYDVPTLMHLVQPDGKKQAAVVYSGAANAPQPGQFPPEIADFYDLSLGDYEVTVSTGPSYESQRQATEGWLMDLFKAVPELAKIGVDIVLENADNPAALQLAKRFKATLPPQFQDDATQAAQLPRLQAENQQLQQHAQIAHNAIVQMAKVIDQEDISARAKIEVAAIQARATLGAALIKAGSATEIQAAEHAAQHFDAVLEASFTAAQSDVEHGQAQELQAQGAQQSQDAQVQAAALQPPPAPAASGSAP